MLIFTKLSDQSFVNIHSVIQGDDLSVLLGLDLSGNTVLPITVR